MTRDDAIDCLRTLLVSYVLSERIMGGKDYSLKDAERFVDDLTEPLFAALTSDTHNHREAGEFGEGATVRRSPVLPEGQTPLNPWLRHTLLDVINEGSEARDTDATSPYHGHSLEHCLHATGWVQRDLRLALDAANKRIKELEAKP